MDTYADDLAKLVETLDLRNGIHVGHSTGGGEVARYIGRQEKRRESDRCAPIFES
jgi:non-heme chloroperoxidase